MDSSNFHVPTTLQQMTPPFLTQNVSASLYRSSTTINTNNKINISSCSFFILGLTAISQIFRVIDEQSQASFDENFNFISYYNWTGGNGALSPAVNNAGNGEPKGYSGLVGTHHRPSDDLSTFGLLFLPTLTYCLQRTNIKYMYVDASQPS